MGAGLEGEPFSAIETRRAVARMAREPGVQNVEYRLLQQGANALRILFLVDVAPEKKKEEGLPSGILTGDLADFPVFYKDDRSLVTAIVAGGLGVGVVSRHALHGHQKENGVSVIDVQGFPLPSAWHIVYPAGKKLSPLALAFKQHVLKQISRRK
jgi:DNA-binding transcriptional LysR family regulator